MLELVVGHVTCISLVRRPLSSSFAAVYKFQRAHHSETDFPAGQLPGRMQTLDAMPLLESD